MSIRALIVLFVLGFVVLRYGDEIGRINELIDRVLRRDKFFETRQSTLAIGDLRDFLVRDPLVYRVGDTKHVITVPKGFATDLASIPWIFRLVLPRDGVYVSAAILHDYLYWTQHCTRSESDTVMRLAMSEYGVNVFQRWLIYGGVRIGGFWAWRENKKSREAGRTRFVSGEFVDGTLSARVTSRESFEDILTAAKAKGQLVFSDPSNAEIRAACQAAAAL